MFNAKFTIQCLPGHLCLDFEALGVLLSSILRVQGCIFKVLGAPEFHFDSSGGSFLEFGVP